MTDQAATTVLHEPDLYAITALIGDAKPAQTKLLVRLAESVQMRREHAHPKWEDLFCMNLISWAGERMGPVLRRLVDAEARVARIEAERNCLAMAVLFATQWKPDAPMSLREGIEEILDTMPEAPEPATASVARASVLREASEHTRQSCPTRDHVKAGACHPCRDAADRINRLADSVEAGLTDAAHASPPGAETPTPADVLREAADRILALGIARGWSIWAADLIHPDRKFVDTGAPDDEESEVLYGAADDGRPGTTGHYRVAGTRRTWCDERISAPWPTKRAPWEVCPGCKDARAAAEAAQQQPSCSGAAIDHDETGICNHPKPQH
jgi:hypothetical protein